MMAVPSRDESPTRPGLKPRPQAGLRSLWEESLRFLGNTGGVETTWDGLPIAREDPRASSVVVWRRAPSGREYLLLHRHHHGPDYAGDWAWTPPSGARQPGETPEEAAARELLEETGLELPFVPVPPVTEVVALYCAESPAESEVRIDPEHDAFEWLTLDEAVARCLPAIVGESLRSVDAYLGE
jgi:8-oxo-dGTP pyrophosphatase MutT (NUDIX family)